MDRKNFFYRQLVTEAEIDAAFTDVDNGFKNLLVDQGLSGVLSGFTPSSPSVSPYQVTLSSGIAYSKTLGRRLNYAGGVVSLATDELSNPVTLPSIGNMQVISLFLEPAYTETDPRTDGYGIPVNFIKTETLTIKVAVSAYSSIPTVPPLTALRSDQILVADVVTYRENSGTLYIFVVTAEPVVTTSVSPAGTFTVNPRTEYLLPVLAGDYLGDGVTLGGKIKDAVSNLALKLKGYQTANTLSSLAASPANSADVNHPASHDAFSAGGTFQNKPGFYLLKKIAGVSTYEPTVDVVFSPDQEVSGGSPGAANHVIDLDANSVDLNLVTEGKFRVKNVTLKGTTASYKVATSAGPNAVEMENVELDPITAGNKLFFNVQNATGSKFRKNYGLSLKNFDSGSSNLVMGARVDVSGLPITTVEDLVSGNLTIDGNGGYYRNIRLEGTDINSAVLNLTGDNNIIENLVVASPLGNAAMISISGKNNIIRNVYLYNFGGHGSSFEAIEFTPSSTNNKIEALYIQGGSNAFIGSDTDIANVAEWTPSFVTSITDLVDDAANQPLADTIAFSANASSQVVTTGMSPPNTTCVVEVWAKLVSGNGTFKIKSGAGIVPLASTATTEWKRFRNIITSSNSQTVIINEDSTAKTITFANPARYTLTNLGSIDLIKLDGSFNSIEGLIVENLQGLSSGNSLINFISNTNKVSNVTFDGLYNIAGNLLNGKINVDGFKLINSHVITATYLLLSSSNSILRNIDLDLGNTSYNNTSINKTLLYITGSSTTEQTIVENVRLVSSATAETISSALFVDSSTPPILFKNCLISSSPFNGFSTTLTIVSSSNLVFDSCTIIQDSKGKTLRVTGSNISFRECKFYTRSVVTGSLEQDEFNVVCTGTEPIRFIDSYLEIRHGNDTTISERFSFNRLAGVTTGTGPIEINGLSVLLNYASTYLNQDLFYFSAGTSTIVKAGGIHKLSIDFGLKRLHKNTPVRAVVFNGSQMSSTLLVTDLVLTGVAEPDPALSGSLADTCSLVVLNKASVVGGSVQGTYQGFSSAYWKAIFELTAEGDSVSGVTFWRNDSLNKGRLFYISGENGIVKDNSLIVNDLAFGESAQGWFCYAAANRCVISDNNIRVVTGTGFLTTAEESIHLTTTANYCQIHNNLISLPGETRSIGTEGDNTSILGNTLLNDFTTTVYPIHVYVTSSTSNLSGNFLNNIGAGTSSLISDTITTIMGTDVANLGVTASTTQTQAGGIALGLLGDYINVTTCANALDTIALPTAVPGRRITVRNSGNQSLQVFPFTDDNLGLGVNLPTVIPIGNARHFVAISFSTWVIESQSAIDGFLVVGAPTRRRFISPHLGQGADWYPVLISDLLVMTTTVDSSRLAFPIDLPSSSIITQVRVGVTVTGVPGGSDGPYLRLDRVIPDTSTGTASSALVVAILGSNADGSSVLSTGVISAYVDRGLGLDSAVEIYLLQIKAAAGGATQTTLNWIEVQFTDTTIWNR